MNILSKLSVNKKKTQTTHQPINKPTEMKKKKKEKRVKKEKKSSYYIWNETIWE